MPRNRAPCHLDRHNWRRALDERRNQHSKDIIVGVLILGALLVRGGYLAAAEAALPLTVIATIAVSTGAFKR